MDEFQRKLKQEILNEINKYKEIIHKVEDLKGNLNKLKNACKHEEAYIVGGYSDPIEGKSYKEIYCPDCEREWNERASICKRQTKEEYESKNIQ